MEFLPADIIITTDRKSRLSSAILSVLRFFQKDPVEYQHSMLVIDNSRCIEANIKVEINKLEDRFKDLKKYKVIRHLDLTEQTRQEIVGRAKIMLGKKYGFSRMFLQLLDQIFHTNYFTRRTKDEDNQICSSLIAWAYYSLAGIRFNGVDWCSVEPDDIDDESLKSESRFETVFEWEINNG